jgi:endonuclease/exonuclease/phosphatase family metal-dependent hydrolase
MKIISLNTWGGRGGKENLLKFIEKYKDTDVFCLQEMWSGGEHMGGEITGGVTLKNIAYRLLTDIEGILTNHDVYFRPHYHDWYGLAIFVKKDFKVTDEGDMYVYKEKGWASDEDKGNHARNIQWITVETSSGLRTIINFHGLWNGQGKGDSEDRLLQSDNILNFIKGLSTPHVLMGDFNLRPDTESIRKFEDFGLKNLIKKYGIASTRTSLYTKPEKFADYTFVSNEIKVNDFQILPEEVSDHAAMFINFE